MGVVACCAVEVDIFSRAFDDVDVVELFRIQRVVHLVMDAELAVSVETLPCVLSRPPILAVHILA